MVQQNVAQSTRQIGFEDLNNSSVVRAPTQSPIASVSGGGWSDVLNTLQITPSIPLMPQTVSNSLVRRYKETALITTMNRLPVRFVGYASPFSGTRIFKGPNCDWAMMYLGEDPVYCFHGNKLYAPHHVTTDVKRMAAAGLKFDAIFVAHEIPTGAVKPGQKISLDLIVPPPPPKVMKRLRFLEKTSGSWWHIIRNAIKGALVAPIVAGVAAGTVATLPAAGIVALAAADPILFGVQLDNACKLDGQPVGMWYYLTHWYWPAEDDQNAR